MNPSRGSVIASLLIALALTSGCTVKPLLATGDSGRAGEPVAADLASIAIAPVSTRYAQQVRNDLIFLLTGGNARPSAPRYTLNLGIDRRTSAAATIQVVNEEEPTAELMTLTANYTLRDNATGAVVAKGTRQVTSSYDVPRQEYAVVRAEIDAENRAARELAELLRLTIGQSLARKGGEG